MKVTSVVDARCGWPSESDLDRGIGTDEMSTSQRKTQCKTGLQPN
jgi:hypothetical protein